MGGFHCVACVKCTYIYSVETKSQALELDGNISLDDKQRSRCQV